MVGIRTRRLVTWRRLYVGVLPPRFKEERRWARRGGAMRAILFEDVGVVGFGDYPQPTVVEQDDVVVKVTTAAICGSDLHVLEGRLPGMRLGSVLGHEFVGEVVDTGANVRRF